MMIDQELLAALKQRLQRHYGMRLKGVIMFGSEARGQANEESDVDLMVLLDGPVDTGKEIRMSTDSFYDLLIEREFFRPVEILPVDFDDFQNINLGIYKNVKEEGIWL